jgi:pre-mRNA branch site protein p14
MYDIFGKYGTIRQIRVGVKPDTRGTVRIFGFLAHVFNIKYPCLTPPKPPLLQAYVVYDDIYDAKNACDHLSGFNVCGRYIVVLYYQPTKVRCCDEACLWVVLTLCMDRRTPRSIL